MATTIDPVLVEFGAKIDALVNGVNEVKTHLASIQQSADSLGDGFNKLKEILATVFSVEAVIHYIESMAALGLQIERNMSILGASAQTVVQLGGMAQLVGQDMDGLALAFNRLTLNVQKSTRDAFNPQAQALKLLGINAQQFIGLNFDQKMDALQSAVSRFNPSLNLTNVLTEIGGRGFANQLPLLQKTKEEWEAMKVAVEHAREGLAAAAPGMADTHQKLTLMSESIQSLGARVFSVLKPAIDLAVTQITKLVQGIDTKTIQSILTSVIDAIAKFFLDIVNIAEQIGILIDAVGLKIRSLLAPLIVLDYVTDAIASGMKKMADTVDGMVSTSKKVEQTTTVWDNLRKTIEAARVAAQGFVNAQGAVTPPHAGGANMGAINFDAAKASADRLKVIQDEYKLRNDLIQKDYGDFIFSEGAKTQALLASLNTRYQEEIKAGEKTSVAYAKFALDRQKIIDAANKVYEAGLNNAFSGLQSAINGQLRGMLAGTTTFAQAFKSIIGDMIIWAIQEFEKMAFQWVAHELIKTTATEAGTAARVSAEATGTAATETLGIASTLKSIFQSAAKTFAGVFGFLAPEMGPAAAAPAFGAEGMVVAQSLGIAGLDVGTDYVAKTGLAVIHQGEAVVPAEANTPFTGGTGGQQVSLTINAIDAKSFSSLIRDNPSVFATMIKRAMRDNQMSFKGAH